MDQVLPENTIESKNYWKVTIKKILLIVLILIILWWVFYIYKNHEKSKRHSKYTLVETNTWLGVQASQDNSGTVEITGIVETASTIDIGPITWLYEDNLTSLIKDGRNNFKYDDYCSRMIWNIKELKNDIESRTWSMIDTLSIKNLCWKKSNYVSKLDGYDLYLKTYQHLNKSIKETDKYIIYSLIDDNWDLSYIEYPVILYDKTNKTNTLLTISSRIPEFEYLDNDWNLIMLIYSEAWIYGYVLNINSKLILGSYDNVDRDCWDKSLVTNKKNIVLHSFSEDKCWYDFDSRDMKKEQEFKWKLTITNGIPINDYYTWTILWKFQSNDWLHATNDDIIDSVKWNTFIFHINDVRYEIIDNKLVNK